MSSEAVVEVPPPLLYYFQTRFNGHPPFKGDHKFILIESDDEFPRAVTNGFLSSAPPPPIYPIAIPNLEETRKTPNRLVYQVAHEMCHFYLDPFLEHPFVEVVCVMVSLDALEAMEAARSSSPGYYSNYCKAVVETGSFHANDLMMALKDTRIGGAHIALASRLLLAAPATPNDKSRGWSALLKLKSPNVLLPLSKGNWRRMYVDFDEWRLCCDVDEERELVRALASASEDFLVSKQQQQPTWTCLYDYCTIF